MRSRELRGLAFIFVNDYFVEDTGELLGIRADFLHEFRVKIKGYIDPWQGLKYGTYLLLCHQKLFEDNVAVDEISDREVFAGGNKRMIWLGYSEVQRYDYSIWMRLRVTRIPACNDNMFSKQRFLCSIQTVDRALSFAEGHSIERIYILPDLFTGLMPILYPDELKRVLRSFSYDKLYIGYTSHYRSFVIYPFKYKREIPRPYCGD